MANKSLADLALGLGRGERPIGCYLNSFAAALFQWNPAPEAGLIRGFMTWIEDYAMSTRREDYRQYAFDCVRLADKIKDRTEREILLEMADAWTAIAVRAPLLIEHSYVRHVHPLQRS
jgi:hypothetical protein